MAGVARCSGCDASWTAELAAHCGTCHEQFRIVADFDSHRYKGSCWPGEIDGDNYVHMYTSGEQIHETYLQKVDGLWSTDLGHEHYANLLSRAAKAREGRGKKNEEA